MHLSAPIQHPYLLETITLESRSGLEQASSSSSKTVQDAFILHRDTQDMGRDGYMGTPHTRIPPPSLPLGRDLWVEASDGKWG